MQSKYINRYNSFCKSLNNLRKSKTANPSADFVLEGTVQNFNLTFDISWKVMKDILTKQLGLLDFGIGSPREVLRAAFSNALIDDDNWLDMLKCRNQLAHDYDSSFAALSFNKIVDTYIELFEKFMITCDKYYENEKK